jgi:hypothetical protein
MPNPARRDSLVKKLNAGRSVAMEGRDTNIR